MEINRSQYTSDVYSFKDIFIISLKDYILSFPIFWKLWLSILLMPFPFILLYYLFLYFNLTLLAAVSLILYSALNIFFITPFIFIYTLELLNQKQSLSWGNFYNLIKKSIKNLSLLKQYPTLAMRIIRMDININILQLTTITRPGNDPFLEKSESIEKYYPYFLQDVIPYLIQDNKDPNKIYSLADNIGPENKKVINQYILDEITFCLFWGLLFIAIFSLFIYLTSDKISRFIVSVVTSTDLTYIMPGFSLWIILLPFFFVMQFISGFLFFYQYSAYKYFWKNYF